MLMTPTVQAISSDYWENDLQMSTEPWLPRCADGTFMCSWIDGLSRRRLTVLRSLLGRNGGATLAEQREDLRAVRAEVATFYPVERFAFKRSKFATLDYARAVLDEGILEMCRINETEYDTTSLLFALFRTDPKHLITVFHLEKVHTNGFARMKLKGDARAPLEPFKRFLTPEVVRGMLADFDAKCRDGRVSEFKSIVSHGRHHLLFVRRENRRSMVIKSSRAIHAFTPEWIVLDFQDNAKGVDIASKSTKVPAILANRLASLYFGKTCEYENDIQVTYRAQIKSLLDDLVGDRCQFLSLLDVAVRNSPLDGAPLLRIGSEDGRSIAEGVRHFEKAIGHILTNVQLIREIKVLYAGKRLKLTFESLATIEDGFVVRYTDNTLNASERQTFETAIRGKPYGIRALSTEKQGRK